MLLNTVRSRKIEPERLIIHHFTLDRILDAYETFGNAAETQAPGHHRGLVATHLRKTASGGMRRARPS